MKSKDNKKVELTHYEKETLLIQKISLVIQLLLLIIGIIPLFK